MKKLLFLFVLLISTYSELFADLYIKEKVTIETISNNEVIDTKELGVNETWLSATKMKIIEGSKIMIIDITVNKLWYANSESKTYVEADLPLDFKIILPEELQKIRENMLTTGDVETTKETANICGKECKLYKVSYWHPNKGEKENQAHIRVWASDDVHIDLAAFNEMLYNLRKIYNRDDKLINGLSKIKGLQMRMEAQSENLGADKRYVTEVFEISEKEAPEDTYILNEDYGRKGVLTPDDFK